LDFIRGKGRFGGSSEIRYFGVADEIFTGYNFTELLLDDSKATDLNSMSVSAK
jgi:hypothetical protein